MRRAELPGAAELFRPTTRPEPVREANGHTVAGETDRARTERSRPASADARPTRVRRSSGRQRHDEKITVYVSTDELHALESARLGLRREHGVAVDRGRIVREAMAVILADLDAQGADSVLVRRLRDD